MRPAIAAAVIPVVLGLGMVPASADPVTLTAACDASRAALAAGGTVSPDVVVAGERIRVGDRIIEPAGTYGALGAGLRPRDRRAAQRYLRAPQATAWFNPGRFASADGIWGATYDQARQDAVGLPVDCAAAAGALVSRSGSTYQYERATVTLDAEGRVVTWGSGGTTRTYTYGPQTVDPPAATVRYARWQRASQAASLNATLRTIARSVAATVAADPASIEAALRAYLEPDRAVPLRLRPLRRGTLLYARNPYTSTYHAWRVYLRDGTPTARRVAPLP